MDIDLRELKQVTILYAEDDKKVQEQTVSVFEKLFKNTLVAKDGIEALELFKKHINEIDVVVTDINMPNLSGIDLAKSIHQQTKHIPIIFTTAYTDEEYLLKSLELNIDRFITKPLKIKELTSAIQACVKKYKENRRLYKTTKAIASEMITTKKDYDELKEECDFKTQEVAFYKFLTEHFIASIKLDNNGLIQYVSNQFTNIYKYTAIEVKNKPISFICPTPSVVQKKMLEAIKKKEAVGFDGDFQTQDGEVFNFHNIIYPLYENKDEYASGYMIYQSIQR